MYSQNADTGILEVLEIFFMPNHGAQTLTKIFQDSLCGFYNLVAAYR